MTGQIDWFDALVLMTLFCALVAILALIADRWDTRVNQARDQLTRRPYDQEQHDA